MELSYLGEVSQVRITLREVIRGPEAWERIQDANMFNEEPDPGWEYVLTLIRFEHLKAPEPDYQFRLYPLLFTMVSSDGKDYDDVSVVEPSPQLDANLYEGASHEGWAAFLVAEHDDDPLLTIGRDFQGRGGAWWKIEN